jgi:CheY-like chemotaxis protein
MNIEEEKKILIIDDDRNSSALIVRTLEPKGFRTFTVADPEEGVKKAEELEPDLIFVNILFPSSNGLKVSKAIHSREKLGRVPIIMFISYRGELDPKYTGTIGVVDVIVKPLRAEEVLSKTVNLLGEGIFMPIEPEDSEDGVAPEVGAVPDEDRFFREIDTEGREVHGEDVEAFVFEEEEPAEKLSGDEVVPAEEEGPIRADSVPAGEKDTFGWEEEPVAQEDDLSRSDASDLWKDEFSDYGEGAGETPGGGPSAEEEEIRRDEEEWEGTKESASGEPFFFSRDEKDSLIEMNLSNKSGKKKVVMIAAAVLVIAGIVVAGLEVKKFFFSGAEEQGSVTEISEAPVETPPGAGSVKKEEPPMTEEKSPESAPPVKTETQGEAFRYSVQAGAFGSEKNASSFADGLKQKGYDAFIEKDETGKIFRVLVGKFESAGRASEQAGKIRTEEGVKAFVYRK